jgi:hypothetical protein
MTTNYARKSGDKTRREVRFLRGLQRTALVHLSEITSANIDSPARGPRWKTFRLRPEIADVIEALQDRFAANRSVTLTPSEVIAAVLAEALPIITAKEEFN